MHFYDNEENYEKSLHSPLFKVSAWGRRRRRAFEGNCVHHWKSWAGWGEEIIRARMKK